MPLSMKPDAEKERIIAVTPQDDIYKGVLRNPAIQPAIVGGTWYPKLFQPGDEQKTFILHFHGGSFLWGTGRQSDCGVPATALFVQYRFASDPSCTFPAAVQDAVTAYKQASPRHENPCIKHCDIRRFRIRQRCHRTATIPFYRK